MTAVVHRRAVGMVAALLALILAVASCPKREPKDTDWRFTPAAAVR